MKNKIILYLKAYKNKEISLMELERLVDGETNYEDFAIEIKRLESEDILRPVKSHKTNLKSIPLYNTYRINKMYFKDRLVDKIQKKKLQINSIIDLDEYYKLKEEEFEDDLVYIEKIDEYIKKNNFPKYEVSSPERSYQIMGDEKWIDEKGGKKILERLSLWEKLKISYQMDPLMIAINPSEINKKSHIHMIVENKASFYMFLEILEKTEFTSLIYGAGWKIVSNIAMLNIQLGLKNPINKIYYFGDLDYEGISIWNSLNDKIPTVPAVEFYRRLITKPLTIGKENQRLNAVALNNFIENFSENEKNTIVKLLASNNYYPQEGLSKDEVEEIWRTQKWI